MIKDIDVFILCGGEGKRLKKISGEIPKPMVRIGKNPFLDILINYLRSFGFKRFILGIGYQADFIKKYYREHKVPGVEIVFSQEKASLGTGGAVKKAQKFIRSDLFLVLNGDSFLEFDAGSFIKFYKRKKAKSLILLSQAENNRNFGAVTINQRSEVTSFSEKKPQARNNLINGGIYLFSKRIFSEFPKNKKFSLEHDFFPQMIKKGLYGYKKSGFFIDIGTPKRYSAAKKYFFNN